MENLIHCYQCITSSIVCQETMEDKRIVIKSARALP